MERVLRFNNTDQRIAYSAGWKTISNSGVGQNETYPLSSTISAQFFFLFRGTSVRFYGRIGGGGGNLRFRLDVNNTIVSLNGTNVDDGPTLVWSVDNLGDGDHQLWVVINSLQQNGSVAVDYLEVENSSGKGFDLLWAGPNVTNVPKEAIIVDNSSPDIVFSNASQWVSGNNSKYYRRSVSRTNETGASLSFSFDGVAIWYYSDVDTTNGFYTISIDGSEPEQLNGKNDGGQLTQQMLWSKTDLTPGSHIFVLRQYDLGGKYMSLDFFRILRANNESALPSSTPTSQGAIAPESKPNIVPLAVGLTFGLLTLVMVVLGAFYLRRRRRNNLAARARRRKSALLDTSIAPLHHTPSAQGDQLSGPPQENKRRSQPTQLPTHGSTPSSGAPTATAVPIAFSGINEAEIPPSYESHMRTARVAQLNN